MATLVLFSVALLCIGHAESTGLRRLLTAMDHFSEHCRENCTAANVAIAPSGTACKLVHPREVEIGIKDHNAAVRNATKLSHDEKAFFYKYAHLFNTDTFVTPTGDQFPSEQHQTFYYDPTRFPPIYSHWHCELAKTGFARQCRLPATGNSSTPVHYGFCRHVCDKRLILRRIEKSPQCTIAETAPAIGSTYAWAWCSEPVKVGVMCVPLNAPELDLSCASGLTTSYQCHHHQYFAPSK